MSLTEFTVPGRGLARNRIFRRPAAAARRAAVRESVIVVGLLCYATADFHVEAGT
jgi:hypothetical protein